MRGGSPAAFIPFAKRIGLLASDGTPTELYRAFEAKATGVQLAEAMRTGYKELFVRDENAHKLGAEQLKSLVIQTTGKEGDSTLVRSVVACFQKLNDFADLSRAGSGDPEDPNEEDPPQESAPLLGGRFNIAYTINLTLPETTNPAVFNAIFKSLKEHLLREPAQ